jgi:hypothetical protein
VAGCSQPGPAATVTVPSPSQAAKPGTPGAPYKVGQRCVGSNNADITIAWSPATNAKSYKVYHSSGLLYGTASSTQFTIRNVPTYSPWGAYLTVYVEACNDAGCTRGPQKTLWIDPCS